MRLSRTALVVCATALVLTGPDARAAASRVVVDPKGDVVTGQSEYDVTSVLVEVGRAKRTGQPTTVSVTLELAGNAAVQPGVSYNVAADTGCGVFYAFAFFSAPDAGPSTEVELTGCGASADPTAGVTVEHRFAASGSKLTWTFSAASLPKPAGVGTRYESPRAYTAVTEPVLGNSTADADELRATALDAGQGPGFTLR